MRVYKGSICNNNLTFNTICSVFQVLFLVPCLGLTTPWGVETTVGPILQVMSWRHREFTCLMLSAQRMMELRFEARKCGSRSQEERATLFFSKMPPGFHLISLRWNSVNKSSLFIDSLWLFYKCFTHMWRANQRTPDMYRKFVTWEKWKKRI